MKRKLIKLLASCSLVVAIIVPAATIVPVENSSTQLLMQTMGHGLGDG